MSGLDVVGNTLLIGGSALPKKISIDSSIIKENNFYRDDDLITRTKLREEGLKIELRKLNSDGRFPQDSGFVKMEKMVIISENKKIIIHYQYNSLTKRVYDMKITSKPLGLQ
ncbi:hypothetical protein E0H86_10090 [Acinetobacter sp. ANC 4635]|uniref:hypothetical protein n=1 Tax=Acinetobacter sp. ANC 4635 TaxID=2529846 RepID=UPI00103B0CF4|nr:hypothetical protein [Acinetobacter sp. ANC 4635]TCB30109.1 hypothetical protein E0H86_10090 [Acinetobacter sp. ANC 4635]